MTTLTIVKFDVNILDAQGMKIIFWGVKITSTCVADCYCGFRLSLHRKQQQYLTCIKNTVYTV